MKFKVGDRIKVVSSDRVGYAYATIERAKPSEGVYWVQWEHHPGQHDYKVEDVDDVWEHACPVVMVQTSGTVTITLPQAQGATHYQVYGRSKEAPNRDLIEKCEHKWVDYYGFTTCYQFCEHCDETRPLVWFK